jgi:hypothetical protein
MDRKKSNDTTHSAVGNKIKREALKIKSQYNEENRHKSLPRPTPPFSKKASINDDSAQNSSRSRNGKFKT